MRITVRVKPGASRASVGGEYGSGELIVAVNAPPVDGRANEAVAKAVADAFEIRSRNVSVVAGHTSRSKVLELNGDETVLEQRLQALLADR